MILVSGHNNKPVGEIDKVNFISGASGQFLKIRSNDDSIFRELLDLTHNSFFIIYKYRFIMFSDIKYQKWVESKDWYDNDLPGKSLKIKCSVSDGYFISEDVYKSYYRDLNLNLLLK